MKRYLKHFWYFVSATIATANLIAVYIFWGWVKQTELQLPGALKLDFSQYLAIQAYQNTVLQAFLVIFALGLAILGFYGFSSIRQASIDAAVDAGKKAAENVAKEIAEKFMDEATKRLNLGAPSFIYETKDEKIEEVKGKDKIKTRKTKKKEGGVYE